ncbi:MAG: hypothetical protein CL609_17830 [Anaerolineaceae bacterium]|nr:hypothetical protein [Anaerolineaceae bacterium]
MTQTITKYKWFWAWNDDKEEAWLEEMASQGFHLISANFIANYTFEVGEPKKMVYRLDFYFDDRKKYQEYIQLFADAGWELVSEFGGWQYFRTEQVGSTIPEIYTDKDSKLVKYQRLMLYLTIFLPIFFMMLNINSPFTGPFGWLYNGVRIFMGLFFFVYAYAMVKLLQRINTLKKGNSQTKKH